MMACELFELVTVVAVEKALHIDHRIISHAMDLYEATEGKRGLPFVRLGSRRKLRWESVRKWLERLEKESIGL